MTSTDSPSPSMIELDPFTSCPAVGRSNSKRNTVRTVSAAEMPPQTFAAESNVGEGTPSIPASPPFSSGIHTENDGGAAAAPAQELHIQTEITEKQTGSNQAGELPKDAVLDPKEKALVDYLIKQMRLLKTEDKTGWADISATLSDIDEQRIGHCKDDIDTLLVFAGLFSAILTAFLIESYQRLSPNSTDQLLSQLLAQSGSYRISNSYMNSTAPNPPPPPFEYSSSDLRVNFLWFLSLTLTLTTASLGLLIKQWLREYKIVDPQQANLRARLRIRQFRYPGLIHWKVFELASFLPLLIQVALGLFLGGLCTFTYDVHAQIGRANFALVFAWMAFFILAAFAPSVSSDCPYKLSLLGPVVRRIRQCLLRFVVLRWLYIGPLLDASGRSRGVLKWPKISFRRFNFGQTIYSVYFPILLVLPWASKPPNDHTSPLEESAVARDERRDVEMLVTVDDVLLDDDILRTTMRSVMESNEHPPKAAFDFVVKVLSHRLPRTHLSPEAFHSISLHGLSARATHAVIGITCDALRRFRTSTPSNTSSADLSWVCCALIILQRATITCDHPAAGKEAQQVLQFFFQDPELRQAMVGSSIVAQWSFEASWEFFSSFTVPMWRDDPCLLAMEIIRSQYRKYTRFMDRSLAMLLACPLSIDDLFAFTSVVHSCLRHGRAWPEGTFSSTQRTLWCFEAVLSREVAVRGASDWMEIVTLARTALQFESFISIPHVAFRAVMPPTITREYVSRINFDASEYWESFLELAISLLEDRHGISAEGAIPEVVDENRGRFPPSGTGATMTAAEECPRASQPSELVVVLIMLLEEYASWPVEKAQRASRGPQYPSGRQRRLPQHFYMMKFRRVANIAARLQATDEDEDDIGSALLVALSKGIQQQARVLGAKRVGLSHDAYTLLLKIVPQRWPMDAERVGAQTSTRTAALDTLAEALHLFVPDVDHVSTNRFKELFCCPRSADTDPRAPRRFQQGTKDAMRENASRALVARVYWSRCLGLLPQLPHAPGSRNTSPDWPESPY